VAYLLSLQGYVPPLLLLIQATEKKIHLVMQFLVWMISSSLTVLTFTLMNSLL